MFLVCGGMLAQEVVFMEPLGTIDTNVAEVRADRPVYRVVDGARYRTWLENESARRALLWENGRIGR